MAFWVTYAKKLIAKAIAGGFATPAEGPRPREQCLVCGRSFPPEIMEDGFCVSCRIAYQERESGRSGGNGGRSSQSSRPPDGLAEAYRILGCKASDSDAEIKRRYRAIIKECHVDSLPKDLPDYLRDAANKRFREVHESYETIMNSRKG
ncbi:MAG: J domain-containing protein [Pseudomonadota bacterium]